MLKVWLREPHHSDDEAIKLMVDETADVSDVLLRVPELLRVQHLKPSELQAEYKDVVLSNRRVVLSVFEGEKEGTFVIRPRPGVVVPDISLINSSPARDGRGKELMRPTSLTSSRTRLLSLPKKNVAAASPRVTPGSLRRLDSFGKNSGKPPVARAFSQASLTARGNEESAQKNRKSCISGSLRDRSTLRDRSPLKDKSTLRDRSPLRDRSTQSRGKTPRRDLSVAASDDRPLPLARHTDPKSVASRFRQHAEKVKVPSKRAQINAVCGSFKPQWGRPLCATCNHSKSSHWASRKAKEKAENSVLSLETNCTVSDNGPIMTKNNSEKIIPVSENNNSIELTKNNDSLLE